VEILRALQIPHEARIVSAHRTPDWLFEYAESARERGLRVIIAGAGGAAHFAGNARIQNSGSCAGRAGSGHPPQRPRLAAFYCANAERRTRRSLAIGKTGAANAALLAAEILAATDEALYQRLAAWRATRTQDVLEQTPRSGAARLSGVPNSSQDRKTSIVRPGGLLAILGGGQLGRMTAMAARTMGYRVRVMDPEAACPASFVVDETIVGRWDDVAAARRLATGADAVTLEIEQIGVDALDEVAKLAPLRPGVEPIRIIQDKTLQKAWLAEAGFPVGPFRVVRSEAELHEAAAALGGRVFLKIGRGGYDGRGQARIGPDPETDTPATKEAIAAAWRSIGERPAVAEQLSIWTTKSA